MSKFKDSYLLIFHGPRRGGKTLSMVVQAIIDIVVNDRKVFSNFPIGFSLLGKWYHTLPLNYYGLLAQDEQYKDSVIIWDETALWASARDSQTVFNKITSLVLTLIGKWEVSFYVGVQFLSLLDRNIKQQADAVTLCTDLSFKYPQLGRGTTISQQLQDYSGRFTGDTFEMSQEWYQRTLHGKFAWSCYNTKQSYDVMAARQKLHIQAGQVNISRDGVVNAFQENTPNYNVDEGNRIIIGHTIKEFQSQCEEQGHPPILHVGEFWARARNNGVVGLDTRSAGKYMMALGVPRVGTFYNPRYDLSNVFPHVPEVDSDATEKPKAPLYNPRKRELVKA